MPTITESVTETDDAQLLRAFVERRDTDALGKIIARHMDEAYRLALRCSSSANDAEDAVQSAFLSVIRCAHQYRGESSVRAWVMRIVVHACKDRQVSEHSRIERQNRVAQSVYSSEVSDEAKRELQAAAVSEAEALPKHYRLPVWLHYLEGLSFKEVSGILQIPENTVRGQANRGIEMIRQSLASAGFTAVLFALPEMLAAEPKATMPARLALTIQVAAKKAALTTAAGATGAVAGITAVKFAALSLVCVVVVVAATHIGGRTPSFQAESENPDASASAPAPAPLAEPREEEAPLPPNVPVVPVADVKARVEILDQELAYSCNNRALPDVLADLEKRVGLRSAFPKAKGTFAFTCDEKNISVRGILQKLAHDGGMVFDIHADRAVLWAPAANDSGRKLNVLLVDADPRWEFRFFKNSLRRDDHVKCTIFQDTPDIADLSKSDPDYIDRFPSMEELSRFHVIIFGNVRRELIADDDLKNLVQFVENGGGIWFIAGKNNFPDTFKDSPLQKLFPVEFERAAEISAEDEREAPPADAWTPVLTADGKTHAITRDIATPGDLSAWEEMPACYWMHKSTRVLPGAVTLLSADTKGTQPLLIASPSGQGRVLFQAFDEFWRMRHPARLGPDAYNRLMVHGLQHLGYPKLELESVP